MNLLPTVEIKN